MENKKVEKREVVIDPNVFYRGKRYEFRDQYENGYYVGSIFVLLEDQGQNDDSNCDFSSDDTSLS